MRAGVVRTVLIQILLQSPRRQAQSALFGGIFQSLKVDLAGRRPSDQLPDFLGDLLLEARLEPLFLTASAEAAADWESSSS